MLQEDKILDLLKSCGKKKKDLLIFLGANWNGSINNIFRTDMRISRLEKIADFFNVSTDYLLGRSQLVSPVTITHSSNVRDFNNPNRQIFSDPGNLLDQLKEKDRVIALKDELIAEKDRAIALLNEIITYERSKNPQNIDK